MVIKNKKNNQAKGAKSCFCIFPCHPICQPKYLFKYGEKKKDKLRAVALMKRKYALKVLLKMVAMATSHILLRFYFIALLLTVSFETLRFNFQTCKFLFRSVQSWTIVLTVNSCFQSFLQFLFRNNFILHQETILHETQWTNYLGSRDRC